MNYPIERVTVKGWIDRLIVRTDVTGEQSEAFRSAVLKSVQEVGIDLDQEFLTMPVQQQFTVKDHAEEIAMEMGLGYFDSVAIVLNWLRREGLGQSCEIEPREAL